MTRTSLPEARFRDLLAAEWIKLWSLRSTYAVLGGGALAAIVINVHAARTDLGRDAAWWADALRSDYNWLHSAFSRLPSISLMLLAATIGALAIAGEHGTGLARTTFTAVPARRQVVLAKAAVLTLVMTAAGTVVAATSFGLSQAILARRGGGFSIGDPGVLAGVAGTALLPAVGGLVGLGIGAAVRHPAAAVFTVFAVLLLLPEATKGDTYPWLAEVHEALPLSAWDTLRNTPFRYVEGGDPFGMPSLVETWAPLAAWPLLAVTVAVIAVHRRDP